MLAVAKANGSATLVAVTTTVCRSVTFGARKSPFSEIVPIFVDHKTRVLLVFSIRAVNCRLPSEATLGLRGVSEIRSAVFPVELVEAVGFKVSLQAVRVASSLGQQ